jgi:hypothetical protein
MAQVISYTSIRSFRANMLSAPGSRVWSSASGHLLWRVSPVMMYA